MHMVIHTKGFSLTESLKDYIQRRLKSALDNRDEHIMRVRVRLSDINGPRGGVDKCCQIRTELAGSPTVIIQNTAENMYAAIDTACERTSHNVGRRIDKLNALKRISQAEKSFLLNQHAFAE